MKPAKWYREWKKRNNLPAPGIYSGDDLSNSLTVIVSIVLAGILIFIVASCDEVFAEQINMDVIAQIESSGDPNAYNERSGAVGLYQITRICLEDYNQYHPDNPIQYHQLYDEGANRRVADWYISKRIPQLLRYYKIEISLLNLISSYNWGIGNTVKWYKNGANFNELPKETQKYFLYYKEMSSLR